VREPPRKRKRKEEYAQRRYLRRQPDREGGRRRRGGSHANSLGLSLFVDKEGKKGSRFLFLWEEGGGERGKGEGGGGEETCRDQEGASLLWRERRGKKGKGPSKVPCRLNSFSMTEDERGREKEGGGKEIVFHVFKPHRSVRGRKGKGEGKGTVRLELRLEQKEKEKGRPNAPL